MSNYKMLLKDTVDEVAGCNSSTSSLCDQPDQQQRLGVNSLPEMAEFVGDTSGAQVRSESLGLETDFADDLPVAMSRSAPTE